VKDYFSKYTGKYACIFLGAYLFLILLTIFHYHHYNFQQGNYKLEQIPESQSPNPFDKFSEVNGECIVSHFANTIYNINYVLILNSEIANSEVCLSLNSDNIFPKLEFNYKPYLRAPPSKLS
jgi:hypothetical protein